MTSSNPAIQKCVEYQDLSCHGGYGFSRAGAGDTSENQPHYIRLDRADLVIAATDRQIHCLVDRIFLHLSINWATNRS
jgi:hypothetical protein